MKKQDSVQWQPSSWILWGLDFCLADRPRENRRRHMQLNSSIMSLPIPGASIFGIQFNPCCHKQRSVNKAKLCLIFALVSGSKTTHHQDLHPNLAQTFVRLNLILTWLCMQTGPYSSTTAFPFPKTVKRIFKSNHDLPVTLMPELALVLTHSTE